MRYQIAMVVVLMLAFCGYPTAGIAKQISKPEGVLVRAIRMEGFLLQDKAQFVRLFKPYRNQYLSTQTIEKLLEEVEKIYEACGYQELVSIEHHMHKNTLIFTAVLAQ